MSSGTDVSKEDNSDRLPSRVFLASQSNLTSKKESRNSKEFSHSGIWEPQQVARPESCLRATQKKSLNCAKAIKPYRSRLQHRVFQPIAIVFSILFLLIFAGCGGDSAETTSTLSATPTDYSQAQNWETLPNASQRVDVLFFYPTTYSATPGTLGTIWTPAWNQSLAQAYADTAIKSHVTSKTGVFAAAGTNLYVPYFQQASGGDLLNALLFSTTPQNAAAANQALQVAYTDVANAFDYYLAHFNKDAKGNPRPFILAGHSQGSNLLLMLLQDKFSDSALRRLLVAAYVIGWSVTSADMHNYPASLAQIGICGIPSTRLKGCIVTYNTQAYAGDWTMAPGSQKLGIVQKNAYSVNPLTWIASGPGEVESPGGSASANLGALFFEGQLGTVSSVTFKLNPDTGDYTYEIDNYTGANNNDGALVINPLALPAPANQPNLTPPYNDVSFFHNYDYNFFYRNVERNVVDRINFYNSQ